MSKKSRQSAIKAGTPARPGSAADGSDPRDELERALAALWKAVAAGDVLNAEFSTSAFVALPDLTDSAPEEATILPEALISAASRHSERSEAAAFLRLLMSLGPRAVKRAASQALAGYTSDGVYPPSWVTSIGKPDPGRAWRQYDVFGEREIIAVAFSYEDAEHALLVAVDRTELPTVSMIGMGDDVDGMLKTLQDDAAPHERFESITPAEARQRIAEPIARAGTDPDYELDSSSILFLPLARSRVRRLPSDDSGHAAVYTAADRAAAVEEFLRSPDADAAGDPDAARFWATVLTGYGSRVPGEPPAQVGPHKLAAMLLVHIASTFTVTPAQFDALVPAVTAWTRWAAARQGLDEAATDMVLTRLPEILEAFPGQYEDPYAVASRSYVRDLAAPDVDLSWLADQFARRVFAAPLPGERPAGLDKLDATSTAGRRQIAVAEFTECATDGAEVIKLLAAVARIVEELWHDDPATTWQRARQLLATGTARHDVIHALTR